MLMQAIVLKDISLKTGTKLVYKYTPILYLSLGKNVLHYCLHKHEISVYYNDL